MSTHNLRPLSEVIKDLKSNGYSDDFIYRDNRLFNTTKNTYHEADEITIKSDYRFEGDSDPADMSILYTIETTNGEKGTLVDSYGVGSNTELEDFLNDAHFDVN